MTFKRFRKWCIVRAKDGHWTPDETELCLKILLEINRLPVWKRWIVWRKLQDGVIHAVVEPVNRRIRKRETEEE